ncbi:hypothetical protein GCM10027347_60550 [Larkinella harenae]
MKNNLLALLGLHKPPHKGPASPPPDEKEDSSPILPVPSTQNKLPQIMGISLLVIFGLLYGLRHITSSLRKNRITPGDPNLTKTVKTNAGKSSLIASIEEEINEKNLNGESVTDDVHLIAKRFQYKPLGQSRRQPLVAEPPKDPVLLPPSGASPITPAPVRAGAAFTKKRVRKKGYSPTPTEQISPPEDPFNTLRVVKTSITESVAASPSGDHRYIPAVAYGKQAVRTRGKVRFRTTEAVTFAGVYIPRNTILTAIAYLGNGRMQFQVPSRLVAGQLLPVDLMCVDRDYQTGVAYQHDEIDDNIRQVGRTTVNEAVADASSLLQYSSAFGVVGAISGTAARGIAQAVTQGKRQKQLSQVDLQDGYPVFFKSTKN